MSVDLTTWLITAAELRAEIGDPSLDTTSETYVADATLTNLIQRYEDIGNQQIDEEVANMTLEKIMELGLHRQSEQVDITPASSADYPNLYVSDLGTSASTYIPVPVKVTDQTTGYELTRDDDIYNTRRATNGLFTSRRYAMIGDVLAKIPANADVLSVHLVLKADAENLIAPQVAAKLNGQIVDAARRMIADRQAIAASFRNENKVEGP